MQGDVLSIGRGLAKSDGNSKGERSSRARVSTGFDGGDGLLQSLSALKQRLRGSGIIPK